MLTLGLGELLLVLIIVILLVGPKDLPYLIKKLSLFNKSIKKLSREFKSSLSEIADQDDFKDIKLTFNEVNKIKNDLNIEDKFETEIETIKEVGSIIEKEVQDINKNDHK